MRIETDGITDQIPFGLLRAPGGTYLGDRFEVTFSQGLSYGLPSGPEDSTHVLSTGSTALVVVASGAPGSSLALLPGADRRVLEVASLFRKPVLVTGRAVTRDEVVAQLREAQLFHFAGHAFAAYNRVGLALGPESLLSSHDIATLHLRNLRLAVLSACDTANGDEGSSADLNSVARSLVAAGVPDVVASRWRRRFDHHS